MEEIITALVLILALGVGIPIGYVERIDWKRLLPKRLRKNSVLPPKNRAEAKSNNLLVMDSVTLPPLDTHGLRHSSQATDKRPFNNGGLYLSEVLYLRANETMDVTIRSNWPISINGNLHKLDRGVFAEITNADIMHENNGTNSCKLQRRDNIWEVRLLYTPERTGFYYLVLTNENDQPCWCQYTMSLRSN